MSLFEIILIAAGLSMDAFAVSICKGLAARKITAKQILIVGAWFGGFQALMPSIGYFLGSSFESYITSFDHWVAFVLLGFIGANMVRASFGKEDAAPSDGSFHPKTMFLLAVATSIDALAVGITFALLPGVNIVTAVSVIGIITFALSGAGLKIGSVFGMKHKAKAEFAGGMILILMGFKILLEHLNIISF